MLLDKKILSRLMISIFLLILLLNFSGCSTTEGGIYTPYEIDEAGVHFSFEYPEDLSQEFKEINIEFPFHKYVNFSVLVEDVVKEKIIHRKQSYIQINVYERGEVVPSAESLIEKYIEINNNKPDSELHIIKRYSTKISGIEATVLHSSYSGQYDSGAATVAIDIVDWSIYFEYDEQVWWIDISYPVEMSSEAKVDFNHMLKTFKILN
jgi:hypothetical protein